MGSNQFQKEYIAYLEEKNEKLLEKLTLLKKSYEDKILTNDLNKHCVLKALEDLLSVSSALPIEINLFFEKMTSAMEILKNLLVRKSELAQVIERVSKTVTTKNNYNTDFLIDDSRLGTVAKSNMAGKKVKVAPMIDGHVILTESRIYLNRIENFSPRSENPNQLSPLVEVSPEANLDSFTNETSNLKELRIPLERIDSNSSHSNENKDSPKSRFSGSKRWKKTSLPKSPVLQKEQTEHSSPASAKVKSKNISDFDPLEGTSWMYSENNNSQTSPLNGLSCFVDCRPRKNRFSRIFDKDKSSETQVRQSPRKTLNQSKSILNRSRALDSTTVNYNRETSNSSQDIIGETFNIQQESEETLEKNNSSLSREYIDESGDENGFEKFERKIKNITSTPTVKFKNKTPSLTPKKAASKSEFEVKEKTFNKNFNKLYKRNSLELEGDENMFQETPKSVSSSSKMTFTSECEENGCGGTDKKRSKKSNSLKPKKRKTKHKKKKASTFEKLLKTEEPKETTVSLPQPKKSSPRSKVIVENKNLKVESESSLNPQVFEGKKKRKAAPTNLCEPNIRVKLRRD